MEGGGGVGTLRNFGRNVLQREWKRYKIIDRRTIDVPLLLELRSRRAQLIIYPETRHACLTMKNHPVRRRSENTRRECNNSRNIKVAPRRWERRGRRRGGLSPPLHFLARIETLVDGKYGPGATRSAPLKWNSVFESGCGQCARCCRR